MKIKVDRKDLARILEMASVIADRKSPMDIVHNIKIDTVENSSKIMISATDLNMFYSAILDADISEDGAVTIPAKTIFDSIRRMDDGKVLFELKGDQVKVKSGRAKLKFLTMPSEDFPIIPSYSEVDFFEIDSSLLSTMIDQTAFSMCSDTTRYNINGALFQSENSRMRMVTTDGHRLSKSEYSVECLCGDFSVTIPYKAIVEIKHLAKGIGRVFFGFNDNLVFFKIKNEKSEIIFSSKLIEDDFPSYRLVIPALNDEYIAVSRQKFIDSLKRMIVISEDSNFGIKLELSDGLISIKAQNIAIGKGSDSIDVSYSGDLLSVGLNARYMLDVLNALKDDEIRIRITDKFGFDAFVINGIDDSFIGLIMLEFPFQAVRIDD